MIVSILVGVLILAGIYKVFEKAGEAGWKIFIPFYNVYILYKISGMSKGKTMFMIFSPLIIGVLFVISFASAIVSLLSGSVSSYGMTSSTTTMGGGSVIVSLISFAISIVMMVFSFQQSKSLALKFGKTTGFGVGLWLLAPVFYAILGFGKDVYVDDYANTSYGFNGNHGDPNLMYGTNNINNQMNPYINNVNNNQNNMYNDNSGIVNEQINNVNSQPVVTSVSEMSDNSYNSYNVNNSGYNDNSGIVNEQINNVNSQPVVTPVSEMSDNNYIDNASTLESVNNSEGVYNALNTNEVGEKPVFDVRDDSEPIIQINESASNQEIVENRFDNVFDKKEDYSVNNNVVNTFDSSNNLFAMVKPTMEGFSNTSDDSVNIEPKVDTFVKEENVNIDRSSSMPSVNYEEKVDSSNSEVISNDINMIDVSFNDSNDNQEIL